MVESIRGFYETSKTAVSLNCDGLTAAEISLLIDVAIQLFNGSAKKSRYALDRCTFFADSGYDILVKLVSQHPDFANPCIEGCDENPFDQHYWLSADLVNEGESRKVIFDPIFGYVGRADKTRNPYYDNKRVVTPNVPAWEGGVRINTMSI